MTLWYRVAPSDSANNDDWWMVPSRHQGAGRADNPRHYIALYLSREPQGAVAEAYANMPTWTPEMFTRPHDGAARNSLLAMDVPDDLRIVDLDHAPTLHRLGLRPTDVVRRNRDRTQEVALRLFLEEPLGLRHPAVRLAADIMRRPIQTAWDAVSR